MRVLLINPPYVTITSRLGVGHQVPLGLLMVGGTLIDAGHEVTLLDAESRHLSIDRIVREVRRRAPDVVMTGHAGSTPAHPITTAMLRALKAAVPDVMTVYGGVYPTYEAERILAAEPAIDVIVRGEGEETTRRLMAALATPGADLGDVPGLAYRTAAGRVVMTEPAVPIQALDDHRVGFELIDDWDRYRCFGLGRAAIVQFSRGCPHRCTYCGQYAFWKRWRHRDPIRLVDEIERLHREHGVRFFTLADENPTTMRDVWRAFLDELARRQLDVRLFATIRATDIVRDADMLDLYRRAGILYILMGIESTNARTLEAIEKRSDTAHDLQACRLLKQHGIFSIVGHIVGLEEETLADFRAARRNLAHYDGDHLNAMYVTPHPWTPFARSVAHRRVADADLSRWDYRHQVLAQAHLKPWQLFAAAKALELHFHLRPRRLWRLFTERDPERRQQQFWCLRHEAMVFFAEVFEFVRRSLRRPPTVTVGQFHAMPPVDEGALGPASRRPAVGAAPAPAPR